VDVVPDENIEAIPVELHRKSLEHGDATEEFGVAVEILVRPEVERENGSRRVINGSEQRAGRGVLPEPVMGAPVEEYERSLPRFSKPSRSMLRRASVMNRGDLGRSADASHEFTRDKDPLALTELFREVMVVKSQIRRAQ
jgi:hypothetical protein